MSITNKIKSLFIKKNKVVSYSGRYSSFGEAASICGKGYSDEAIFEKVKNSTLAVVNGEAAYERDSCLFYEKKINYNLMMYLYMIMIKEGCLNVLDWGGALGSTFYQHRELLEDYNCNWTIVEQAHFVSFGKEHLANNMLHFVGSLDEVDQCNCVLFSSVLQYLENPEGSISMVCEKRPSYIIVERTPVSIHKRIWVETVHEPIYEAEYPCYVFEETELIKQFETRGYRLIDSWKSMVDGDVITPEKEKVVFKSYIFKRK